MPLDLDLVRVTGRFVFASGPPASGEVTFAPSHYLRHRPSGTVVLPSTIVARLDDDGHLYDPSDPLSGPGIALPATDDPNVEPVGWSYVVTETIDVPTDTRVTRTRSGYRLTLPRAAATVDLADVATQEPPEPTASPGVSLATFRTWLPAPTPDTPDGAVLTVAPGRASAQWVAPGESAHPDLVAHLALGLAAQSDLDLVRDAFDSLGEAAAFTAEYAALAIYDEPDGWPARPDVDRPVRFAKRYPTSPLPDETHGIRDGDEVVAYYAAEGSA